ncbi:MAG: Zn-dependent hydrolase [Bdellovibrionales bacterium]|nr:Zn-dependent hydrolase [Bdellovibrionales bacterium]
MKITRQKYERSISSNSPRISIQRLENDIIELGRIGKNDQDGGVYRPAFSPADMEARKWLTHKISEARLQPSMDGAANVFGLLKSKAEKKKSFLVGSHLDSVPCAGVLDGPLGVLAALECLRVIKEQNIPLKENVELIATSDEEGRFGGMLGSEAICGAWSPDRIQKARDIHGIYLTDAMKNCGLDPMNILSAQRSRQSMIGFLELHIEQGPILYQKEIDIGIVESISGLFHWQVVLIGESNHSGTTPMLGRKDAFQGMCEFSGEIPRIIEENGTDDARATIGMVQVRPPSAHTVPGRVEFSLVGRDFTPDSLEELKLAFRKALSAISRRRNLMFEFEEIAKIMPTTCDNAFVNIIENEAKNMNCSHMRMPSGAGHDGQFFGRYMPAGMIFIPSLHGVSHSPDEWSSLEHIEMGANLLLQSLLQIVGS